jgi:hypothetical protein
MAATPTNITTSDATHARNVVVDETLILNSSQAAAIAIATAGTITTQGIGYARFAPAGAVTGLIMQAGLYHGQTITVQNNAIAANTMTFAASGTSNVADGVSAVITGPAKKDFIWDAVASLWYHN